MDRGPVWGDKRSLARIKTEKWPIVNQSLHIQIEDCTNNNKNQLHNETGTKGNKRNRKNERENKQNHVNNQNRTGSRKKRKNINTTTITMDKCHNTSTINS